MDFEWDPRKRESNIDKHGVDFVAAARMLSSGPHLTVPDNRPGQNEMRWRAVGPLPDSAQPDRWSGALAVVVFTKREGTYRIISARRASTDERRHYNSQGIRAGPP
jgi:uncharacterized DUF497 family protein